MILEICHFAYTQLYYIGVGLMAQRAKVFVIFIVTAGLPQYYSC